MFVPSESVYAEIHDGFDDVIQKAYRARVVLVSPSLLMLAIQVMQQILKDARMRDAADQIRTEVLNLGDDLGRLRDRVLKLQKHFGDVNEDVRQILISADKIEKRAGRIEELDFSKTEAPAEAPRIVKPGAPELFPLAAEAAGGGVAASLLPLWEYEALRNRLRTHGKRKSVPCGLHAVPCANSIPGRQLLAMLSASERGMIDHCLPVPATSSLPPLPIKAGWRGLQSLSGCKLNFGILAASFETASVDCRALLRCRNDLPAKNHFRQTARSRRPRGVGSGTPRHCPAN